MFIHFLKKENVKITENSEKEIRKIKNIKILPFISKPKNIKRYKWVCDFENKKTSLNFVRKKSPKINVVVCCNKCNKKIKTTTFSFLFSLLNSSTISEIKLSDRLNKQCLSCARSDNSINGLEKRKKTCLERYGYESNLMIPELQKNIKNILKEKYGESCYKEFADKRKKTFYRKYGVEHNTKIPEVLQKMISTRSETIKKLSDEQKNKWNNNRLNSYKKENSPGIFGKKEFNVNSKIAKEFFNKLIFYLNLKENDYEFEFLCEKFYVDFLYKNVCLIEFYGDYWHANPEIYKPNDIIGLKDKILVEKLWEKDEKRTTAIQDKTNLPLIIIWEKSYKENKEKIILDCIETIDIIKKENYEKNRYIH